MGDWEHEYKWAIDQVKFHHGKKKDFIVYAVEQCIIGQVPREKISAKLKKDLEGFADPDYIREVCSAMGVTDLAKANADVIQVNPDGTVMLKGGSRRRPTDDDGEDDDKPKRKRTPEEIQREQYEAENKPIIEHTQDLIDYLEDCKNKLKNKHFLSILAKDKDGMKTYEEYIHVASASIDFARQAWDDRNIVPIQTQFKLHEFVATNTIKHGARLYLGWIKDYSKISSKQVTKILLGKTRDVAIEYEPENETEAHIDEFVGERCENPVCQSYRVKLEHGWCRCYACDLEYEHKAKPLGKFKEDESEE